MQFKTYDCDNCTSVSMANDIRTTKDVIGRLPKSPEAAMLEKARNQLERALENGRISIEERYTQDLVFATTMLTDWQMLSNLRIWEADYPARTVFFYGVSGETLRVANLISDAANPPACMEFGGTFFNVKNFAKLLHHQPKVTSTLLRFQGHWRLPPVHDVQEYANDLNDWHLSNYNVMMGAYNEQKQLADYNWLRLSGSLCYFMTSRTMPEISP
ncbi:unnamed protein product, partial [Symbiodinium pilosum]